jgi:hypothetical protein
MIHTSQVCKLENVSHSCIHQQSLEIFVSKFQEKREQIIDQQEVEEKDPNEGFQSHEEEQEFTYASTEDNKDLVEDREPEDIKPVL